MSFALKRWIERRSPCRKVRPPRCLMVVAPGLEKGSREGALATVAVLVARDCAISVFDATINRKIA
ncbi:hypothetical protein CFBP4996_29205 (plasmid) [Agrobacterium leguminum]|uniref:Uncharacterized protein n=1 Tax=Agrobacterium deltaense NCPPB 1641 TaxID=1183425 RepID=A0A1S7U6P8_9HYPH|nr:hypothetical protein [Agrobacterium leguminum]WFS70147.1 hypothetical protein CFBP4996_29205 [Agrobacterium leguminum]CVI62590.1 hypothetical protein AGR7A_pAt10009 [Agrobacterium deltaense NCPPB 1641]